MWDKVSPEEGQDCENQLSGKFFKPALDLGTQMTRNDSTAKSARHAIRMIIWRRPVVLQIQRELVDEQKDIVDTTAGQILNRKINELIRQHQAKLKEVQEMMLALNKDKVMHELENERKKVQEEMEKMKKDSDEMTTKYAAEKERTDAKEKKIREAKERKRMQERRALEDRPGDLVEIPIYE